MTGGRRANPPADARQESSAAWQPAPSESGPRPPQSRTELLRPLATAVAVLGTAAAPAFLVSSLAPRIGEEVALGEGRLGIAIGAYWAVAAAGSLPAGRLVDRVGGSWGVWIAAGCTALTGLGIAAFASSLAAFAVLLGLAGLASSFAAPGMTALLVGHLRPDQQGTVFGFQLSGPPAGSLLAGVAAPLIAAPLGWRWAFVLAGIVAVAVAASVRPSRFGSSTAGASSRAALGLPAALLTAGGALAAAAATGLVSYLVVFATEVGLSSDQGALLLAVCSAGAIVARAGIGALADRHRRGVLVQVAAMLTVSALGFLLLATEVGIALVAGAALALTIGWGWAGLYVLSAVELYPAAAGRAVGTTALGVYIGAVAGPLVVGGVSSVGSLSLAWVLSAAMSLLAAATFAAAARLAVRSHSVSYDTKRRIGILSADARPPDR